MSTAVNTDLPQGAALPYWQAPAAPAGVPLTGRFGRLERLDPARHGPALHRANALDSAGRNWAYLPYGPFASEADYLDWLAKMAPATDPLFYAIVEQASGEAIGVAAYQRIDRANGVVEVGHLAFSPRLQRTPLATEAMVLMMDHAFALGYRRYEWKCNALNAPSRAAAQRLGFSYEGVFRQAAVVKGHNRDTAWYSVIDGEWPALRDAFARWLSPENFDAQDRQRVSLSSLTAPLLAQRG